MSSTCAIVLNYFGAKKTKRCIRSLLGQTVDTVYLVDNSASEAEANNITELVNSLPKQAAPEIRLLINDENLGFGKAMNRAIRHDMDKNNGHEYYIILNNDSEATPDMVTRLLAGMQQDSDISLIAPRIASAHGESGCWWYNRILGTTSLTKKRLCFPYLSGCCLLFRRNLVESEPLFDEDFFMYGEDVHLSWRIQKSGKKILCARDVKILHEGTGSSNHGDLFYEYHVARGHILLALKTCEHIYDLPLAIAGRILYLSVRALIRSLRYFNPNPLIAFILCWFPLKVRHSDK